jgi:predicted ribosomally synthesized peptide with nif11-like leader
MSEQAAKDFVERVRSDAAFREKIMAEPDAGGRLSLVNAEGYDCSAEEIEGLATEPTPAELDDVVAGWCFDICWTDAASSCPRHFR